MNRASKVIWNGSGKKGIGSISTESGVLDKALYSYNTRFEKGIGTNPEELIAAALAACFTMKLSFLLAEKGFRSETIETDATVTLKKDFSSKAHLKIKAKVPGVSQKVFENCANEAKTNCIISKMLRISISGYGLLLE